MLLSSSSSSSSSSSLLLLRCCIVVVSVVVVAVLFAVPPLFALTFQVTVIFSNVVTLLQSQESTSSNTVATFAYDKFLLLPAAMLVLKLIITYLLQVFIALLEMSPPADRWQSLLYSRRTGMQEDSVAGAVFY